MTWFYQQERFCLRSDNLKFIHLPGTLSQKLIPKFIFFPNASGCEWQLLCLIFIKIYVQMWNVGVEVRKVLIFILPLRQ